MKNTSALAAIILGGMLIYGGYKNWSFADTVRFFTGQPLSGLKPGTVAGHPTAGGRTTGPVPKGYTNNPDASADGKDSNDNIVPLNPNDPATPRIPFTDPRYKTNDKGFREWTG